MIIGLSILFLIYAILVLYYWYGWKMIPLFAAGDKKPGVFVSVIIAARNEEGNISKLLNALLTQSYPRHLMELIVVDDHSTDGTSDEVKKFPSVRLIKLSEPGLNSYKKKAIEKGIEAASGEYILATDADCIPPPGWIHTMVSYQQENNSVFVAAPVMINSESSVVQLFQSMDFMILQGITGAAVHSRQMSMCNGANLLYRKQVYTAVGGFTGIDEIASGDDMLLMHKISTAFPKKVHYLKSPAAIVPTEAVPTWKAFFNQRIRWASKAVRYDDKKIIFVLVIVYFFNLSFLGLAVAGIFQSSYFIVLAGLLVLKTLVELPLFISVATFFKKREMIKWFPLFQPIHIFYTIVSGLFGQFGKYEWKGRRVR